MLNKIAPVVGCQAAIVSGSSYRTYQFGTITKVTPTGQVTVKVGDRETRFGKDHYELGSTHSRFYRPYLETDVDAARAFLVRREAMQKAASALNATRDLETVRSEWGTDSMQKHLAKLEALVAEARKAVEEAARS